MPRFSKRLFPLGFPFYLIVFHSISITIFGQQYKSRSSSCSFLHSLCYLVPLSPKYLSPAPYSPTPSACIFSPSLRETRFHTHMKRLAQLWLWVTHLSFYIVYFRCLSYCRYCWPKQHWADRTSRSRILIVVFCFNTCTVHHLLFCTVTNKCTILSQIISLLHVSTLSCHPQAACNQYLAKLHK
jgi:hypothetical protein